MKVNIQIEGLGRLQSFLDAAPGKAVKALAIGLYNEAERIMDDSKTNYVPVDQGTLRGSGHVQSPEVKGSQVEVAMGYGGPSIPYAVAQHERLDYQHTTGQAKYLEQPALEAAPTASSRIAEDVKDELR